MRNAYKPSPSRLDQLTQELRATAIRRCPFCGSQPMVSLTRPGILIECSGADNHDGCPVNPDVVHPSLREAARLWNERNHWGLTFRVGTCAACGCTDDHACEGGCSWANNNHTLCSRCARLMNVVGIVNANGRWPSRSARTGSRRLVYVGRVAGRTTWTVRKLP